MIKCCVVVLSRPKGIILIPIGSNSVLAQDIVGVKAQFPEQVRFNTELEMSETRIRPSREPDCLILENVDKSEQGDGIRLTIKLVLVNVRAR